MIPIELISAVIDIRYIRNYRSPSDGPVGPNACSKPIRNQENKPCIGLYFVNQAISKAFGGFDTPCLLTEILDGDVVPRLVDVLPVDVRDTLAVPDYVAAHYTAVIRGQPADDHRVGECPRANIRRLAGHRCLCIHTSMNEPINSKDNAIFGIHMQYYCVLNAFHILMLLAKQFTAILCGHNWSARCPLHWLKNFSS